MAVEKGNEIMVRFLLDNGASLDLFEGYGKAALYMACERGHEAMVRCVAEPGLCTPLIAAIDQGRHDREAIL